MYAYNARYYRFFFSSSRVRWSIEKLVILHFAPASNSNFLCGEKEELALVHAWSTSVCISDPYHNARVLHVFEYRSTYYFFTNPIPSVEGTTTHRTGRFLISLSRNLFSSPISFFFCYPFSSLLIREFASNVSESRSMRPPFMSKMRGKKKNQNTLE